MLTACKAAAAGTDSHCNIISSHKRLEYKVNKKMNLLPPWKSAGKENLSRMQALSSKKQKQNKKPESWPIH